jgi:uncharacterized protein (TIGR00255 family)
MTGYGKADNTLSSKKITVEIRSLNSKQIDLTVRMPQEWRQWEYGVRNAIARRLGRGKIDAAVTVESLSSGRGVSIDGELFAAYHAQLKEIGASLGQQWGGELLSAVVRLPDVVRSGAGNIPDEERQALMAALDQALERLDTFRATEGLVMLDDMLGRIDIIMSLLAEVEPFEQARSGAIKKRIREQIENLGVKVDENRLEQEMIFYIERIDITEEKVRLTNHCRYFREVVETEQEAGRKLGFITQEIGREINTLGSKASEANIQRIVVEMKDQLERIKEQILNIL